MEVVLMVCAQSAVIDQASNALSIFNIFQEINSPAFPFGIAGFTIATLLNLDEGETEDPTDVRIRINLGEAQIGDFPMVTQFQGRQSLRSILFLQGILLPAPGNLVVSLHHSGRQLASWVVAIRHIGNPAMEATPAA
jgi:hypothetical protein